jgi:hypothetical protein
VLPCWEGANEAQSRCSFSLQIKFLELSGTKKKALHESKAKDVTAHGMSLPRHGGPRPILWRRLPPQGLRAAIIAATGPGLVFKLFNLYLLQPL